MKYQCLKDFKLWNFSKPVRTQNVLSNVLVTHKHIFNPEIYPKWESDGEFLARGYKVVTTTYHHIKCEF